MFAAATIGFVRGYAEDSHLLDAVGSALLYGLAAIGTIYVLYLIFEPSRTHSEQAERLQSLEADYLSESERASLLKFIDQLIPTCHELLDIFKEEAHFPSTVDETISNMESIVKDSKETVRRISPKYAEYMPDVLPNDETRDMGIRGVRIIISRYVSTLETIRTVALKEKPVD